MKAIAYECTLFGLESKFAIVVGAQIWPASTAKSAKERVDRFGVKQFFKRRGISKDRCRQPINKKCGC
jgi:hypothetical protein